MRARLLFIIAAAWLCGFRCSLPWEDRDPPELFIVSYNAHNLFDDREDGGEYPEFSIGAGRWSADLYERRLENVAAAIGSFSSGGSSGGALESGRLPDIVCLQEIESEKVLVDLAKGALKRGGYRWVALGGPSGSAIKCGILSRYPFAALRAHSLADAWGFGPARDMLEIGVDLGSGKPGLTLLVCHWKSRREGERRRRRLRAAGHPSSPPQGWPRSMPRIPKAPSSSAGISTNPPMSSKEPSIPIPRPSCQAWTRLSRDAYQKPGSRE